MYEVEKNSLILLSQKIFLCYVVRGYNLYNS
jgi:hypothetical protein